MNNDKLILESLGWLLATQNGHSSFSDKERIRLIREIDDVVNPPKQPTIAERTHDAFSQSNDELHRKDAEVGK